MLTQPYSIPRLCAFLTPFCWTKGPLSSLLHFSHSMASKQRLAGEMAEWIQGLALPWGYVTHNITTSIC